MRRSKLNIPAASEVFRRVPHYLIAKDGEARPAAFLNSQGMDRMSVDWDQFSTPEACKQRVAATGNDPRDFAVYGLNVGETNNIVGQTVEHWPSKTNPAHSSVTGDKSELET